ncbi:hypothetical protein A6E08_20880 [Vibrio lentus]|nr:hypothetical protein A6E08_20880 [Vibrio lentus]
MKKKIMKKFGEMNLLHLLDKGKKSFKNNNLLSISFRCGRVEALRKTCFPTLPHLKLIVNKFKYL